MANLTIRSTKGAPLTHEELDGNFEYFTGSIDAITAVTGSFLTSASTSSFLTSASTGSFLTSASTGSFLTSASTGSFLTSASTGSFLTSASTGSFLTSASTGSFITSAQTSSLNISNTLYTVNTALSASATSLATTSICSYGVNVFEYVTPTNRATKLPQPTTGKSVRIINNSKVFLYVYPSNIGGQINNLPINEPAIIPPDGNLYEFICIENPLPGAWTFSAPATGQYDSGEIEMTATSISNSGDNPVVTAIDSNAYGMIDSFFTGTVSVNGRNKPSKLISPAFNINGSNPYSRALFFRPETPWKGIAKIKAYTNLIIGYGELRLMSSGYYNSYIADTGELCGSGNNSTHELFRTDLGNTITGTAVTGSTEYTSANIGDPGTIWDEKVANTDSYSNVSIGDDVEGTFIGNKFISTALYSGSNEYLQDKMIDQYYSSYISFQFHLLPYTDYGTIPDFKFRFIIEYYQ